MLNRYVLAFFLIFALFTAAPGNANGNDSILGMDSEPAQGTGTSVSEPADSAAPADAAGQQQQIGNINTPNDSPRCWYLNMRSGPSMRFDVIKILKGGTPLFIIGKDAQTGWYNVNDGVDTGWCSGKYVQTQGGTPPSAATPAAPASPAAPTAPVADAGPADSGPKPSDSTGTLGSGSLKASDFGYNDPKYQSVFDIVQKFCDANQKYELAKGHTWQDGYASVTDCSGFTGSFYQKLAAISGIPPVFPKNSWYQTSTNYKSNYTDCITTQFPPPDPRDLIKPGDVFVMNKGAKYGHVGVFMGYDKSGNPVIAHSTTSTNRQNIYGKQGTTGVRIEVLPRSYQERWAGIYRIKGTDEMLNKLADKS